MGIHGIYKEIGPGERIALSKLAVQKFEETGRPLRIAIDVSIWLFQIQSGKGGTNPALRTFYYRLLRLLALSIHPIFVFDGPNKPPFKRHKRTGPRVSSVPEFLAKQLLKSFGFPMHLAPGEAEAECALLQRKGIVDAVLSDDVDTLMFGSGTTLRNWSPELSSSKVPTHVNLYDAEKTKKGPSGLDRAGMVLVALMSGGDYVPEGIPGCGPKLACEAARAGFGRDLCSISRSDPNALREWRERLVHELHTNESKFFKRKHPALVIPEEFPRSDILGYYTHPVVSSPDAISRLRQSLNWDQDIDYPALRSFTADAFDWVKLGGAKKFIRNLAPAVLVRELRLRGQRNGPGFREQDAIEREESQLVKSIHSIRNHPSTDLTSELRVAFLPVDIVKIDLEAEEPDDTPADQSDMDDDGISSSQVTEAQKSKAPLHYDPTKVDKVWIFETFAKVGIPMKVQDWEETRRRAAAKKDGKAVNTGNARARKGTAAGQLQESTISQYGRISKPSTSQSSGIRGSKSSNDVRVVDLTENATASDFSPFLNDKAAVRTVDLTSVIPTVTHDALRNGSQRNDRNLATLFKESNPVRSAGVARSRREVIERSNLEVAQSRLTTLQTNGSIQNSNPRSTTAMGSRDVECSPQLYKQQGHIGSPSSANSPATPRRYRQLDIRGFLSPSQLEGASNSVTCLRDPLDAGYIEPAPRPQPRKRQLRRTQTDSSLMFPPEPATPPTARGDIRFADQTSPVLVSPSRRRSKKPRAESICYGETGNSKISESSRQSPILIDSSPRVVSPSDESRPMASSPTSALLSSKDHFRTPSEPPDSPISSYRMGDRTLSRSPNLLRDSGKAKVKLPLQITEGNVIRLRESLNGWFAIESDVEPNWKKAGKVLRDVETIDLTSP